MESVSRNTGKAPSDGRRQRGTCFNGARVSQHGKAGNHMRQDAELAGFNGARVSQHGKAPIDV